MDKAEFGSFIAELRKEKNWTQEDFGGKLLVTNKTISRWETGEYLPPMDVLEAMGSSAINEDYADIHWMTKNIDTAENVSRSIDNA